MLKNVNFPAAPQRQECPKPYSDPFYLFSVSCITATFIAPLPESEADGANEKIPLMGERIQKQSLKTLSLALQSTIPGQKTSVNK